MYFLSHTYKHYSQGGSGLRSLLDVYVFLRAHHDLDREYLNAELAKLEITDFEQKMRTLSQKLYTGADLTEPEQIMLDYMVSSGCAGTTENEEYNHMMTILGSDDSTASKRRYLKNRVFLSGEALQKNYPFVAKHKSLYPLLLVFRPIKGAITHPKGIVDEYKRVKKFKKRKNNH